MSVSIVGLSKAAVLAALYNGSKPQGYGFLQYTPEPMEEEEAAKLLSSNTYFDYLKGRVMKIEISGDEIDTRLYDRDNGEGAGERIINILLNNGATDTEAIEQNHLENTRRAAIQMREAITEETTGKQDGDMFVLTLGAAHDADKFRPVLDDILDNDDE